MTTESIEDLDAVKDVANFLSFVLDQAAFHKFAVDIGNDNCKGMSNIVAWMVERIDACQSAAKKQLEMSQLDFLKKAGLPQEAFVDDMTRRIWRDGFSHGLSYAGKET
jgi:hypothetical protein